MKDRSLLLIVVFIIILGIIVGISTNGKRPENLMKNNEKTNSVNNTIDDNKNNETKNETVENETVENTEAKTDNKEENTESEPTKPTETFNESPKTAEEKAINIVKKDYGDKSSLEYSCEGIDNNGRQIVVVRNAKTTEAYAFYFVDVENNTFVKQ